MSTGPTPEWDESFSWSFESPPKGQKLHISCKNKSKVGKVKELLSELGIQEVQNNVFHISSVSYPNFLWLWQSSFGKVTIQIDRVVMLGAVAGEYTLLPESKSGPSRNLEIEFQWSNK